MTITATDEATGAPALRLARLTVATQTLRPLARLVDTLIDVPSTLKERFATLEQLRDRVSLAEVAELVQAVEHLTGNPDLGLHMALFVHPSDFDVLERVATAAPTWRQACETMCRYVRLLNEAAHYRVEICGDKAHVILGSAVQLGRASADFQLASLHLAIQRWLPDSWPELAVWLKHPEPADMSGYRAIFPSCQLVFRAAFNGFVYDSSRFELSLPTADALRHRMLSAESEQLLAAVHRHDLVARASHDILANMAEGRLAATRTAARLHMARRTLVRKLAVLGTSYSELVKEARYRTAIHYLQNTKHSVADIAFLLGYSECTAFVRAFKRWSGLAPFEYRRAHAQAAIAATIPA